MIQMEADGNNMHNKDLQTRSFGGIASISHSVTQTKAHAKGKKISYEKRVAIATSGVGRCWEYAGLLMPNVRCCGTLVVICWTLRLRCCCDCAYAHRRAKKKKHKCLCNVRGNSHGVVFCVLLLSCTLLLLRGADLLFPNCTCFSLTKHRQLKSPSYTLRKCNIRILFTGYCP